MIDYEKLISKARRQEKFDLVSYIKYRWQNRIAFYTEIKNIYGGYFGTTITRTTEKKKEKKVSFAEFLKLNGSKIVIN